MRKDYRIKFHRAEIVSGKQYSDLWIRKGDTTCMPHVASPEGRKVIMSMDIGQWLFKLGLEQ